MVVVAMWETLLDGSCCSQNITDKLSPTHTEWLRKNCDILFLIIPSAFSAAPAAGRFYETTVSASPPSASSVAPWTWRHQSRTIHLEHTCVRTQKPTYTGQKKYMKLWVQQTFICSPANIRQKGKQRDVISWPHLHINLRHFWNIHFSTKKLSIIPTNKRTVGSVKSPYDTRYKHYGIYLQPMAEKKISSLTEKRIMGMKTKTGNITT